MTLKQMTGLLGSVFLIIGIFVPLSNVPFVGQVSYFNNGAGVGSLILAWILLVMILSEKYKWLWVVVAINASVVLYSFIDLHSLVSGLLIANINTVGRSAVVDSIQVQWGFPILIFGILMVFFCVIIKDVSGD